LVDKKKGKKEGRLLQRSLLGGGDKVIKSGRNKGYYFQKRKKKERTSVVKKLGTAALGGARCNEGKRKKGANKGPRNKIGEGLRGGSLKAD